MSKSITQQISKDVQKGFDEVAEALCRSVDRLSDDAEDAIAQAARAVRETSSVLASKVPVAANDLADKATSEIKEHPLVAAGAALAAAAALIGLLSRARHGAA